MFTAHAFLVGPLNCRKPLHSMQSEWSTTAPIPQLDHQRFLILSHVVMRSKLSALFHYYVRRGSSSLAMMSYHIVMLCLSVKVLSYAPTGSPRPMGFSAVKAHRIPVVLFYGYTTWASKLVIFPNWWIFSPSILSNFSQDANTRDLCPGFYSGVSNPPMLSVFWLLTGLFTINS